MQRIRGVLDVAKFKSCRTGAKTDRRNLDAGALPKVKPRVQDAANLQIDLPATSRRMAVFSCISAVRVICSRLSPSDQFTIAAGLVERLLSELAREWANDRIGGAKPPW
jgi:hypothetical protein